MQSEKQRLQAAKRNGQSEDDSTALKRGNKSASPTRDRNLSPIAKINQLKKIANKTSSTTVNIAKKPTKSPSFVEPPETQLRKTVGADQTRLHATIFKKSSNEMFGKAKAPEQSKKLRLSNVDRSDKLPMSSVTKKVELRHKQHHTILDDNKERDLSKFIADQQSRLMGDSSKHVKKIREFQNKRIKTLGGKSTLFISNYKKHSECNSPSSKPFPSFIKDMSSPSLKIALDHAAADQESVFSKASQEKPSKKKSSAEGGSKGCPTNRPVANVMYSTSPKNIISSERGKKNKRTIALGEVLNFSLLQGGRIKDSSAANIKKNAPEKDQEKNIVTKDYELNDMHKMISFLGKDKGLQIGKLELKEKLKRFRNDFKQSDIMPSDNDEHIEHIDVKVTIGTYR
jgi:hypothetical protein